MEAYWTTQAAELIKADPDVMSDPWRELLRRYLEQTQPEKAATLAAAGQLEAFLTVAVADARELEEALEEQMAGVENAPMLAENLALEHLMPKAGDDVDRPIPEDWEEADAAMADAAAAFLTSNRNPSPK